MLIADVPSRGWFARIPWLSRGGLAVDQYPTMRCPLPGDHIRYLTLESLLYWWWDLTTSHPRCSLVILDRKAHRLQDPAQTRCAFTLAHTAFRFFCAYSYRSTPPSPPTHTHTHTEPWWKWCMRPCTHSTNIHSYLRSSWLLQEGLYG